MLQYMVKWGIFNYESIAKVHRVTTEIYKDWGLIQKLIVINSYVVFRRKLLPSSSG